MGTELCCARDGVEGRIDDERAKRKKDCIDRSRYQVLAISCRAPPTTGAAVVGGGSGGGGGGGGFRLGIRLGLAVLLAFLGHGGEARVRQIAG